MAKKEAAPPEPYWSAQVKVFFDFYQSKFDTEPEFEGPSTRSLKAIIASLRKRAEKKDILWTEDVAKKRLSSFLEFAYEDDLLNKCFVLETINRYKDKVFQKIANPNLHVKRTSIIRPAIEPRNVNLDENWR